MNDHTSHNTNERQSSLSRSAPTDDASDFVGIGTSFATLYSGAGEPQQQQQQQQQQRRRRRRHSTPRPVYQQPEVDPHDPTPACLAQGPSLGGHQVEAAAGLAGLPGSDEPTEKSFRHGTGFDDEDMSEFDRITDANDRPKANGSSVETQARSSGQGHPTCPLRRNQSLVVESSSPEADNVSTTAVAPESAPGSPRVEQPNDHTSGHSPE